MHPNTRVSNARHLVHVNFVPSTITENDAVDNIFNYKINKLYIIIYLRLHWVYKKKAVEG